jgi:ribulose 1,5-bisphosphate synthetase/thiazole synthase
MVGEDVLITGAGPIGLMATVEDWHHKWVLLW